MKARVRAAILHWLGVDAELARHNDRLTNVERHFVTRRDPQSGQPLETLADITAEQDGRPKPKPLRQRRSWDRQRRFLEAKDAQSAQRRAKLQ